MTLFLRLKNSGLNIDKEFIEGVITELIKGNVITNKKTVTVCNSSYCLIETEEERTNKSVITTNDTPVPLINTEIETPLERRLHRI